MGLLWSFVIDLLGALWPLGGELRRERGERKARERLAAESRARRCVKCGSTKVIRLEAGRTCRECGDVT